MRALLDTRALAWVLLDDPRLSGRARAAIAEVDAAFVSPVTLREIARKVRVGRRPEMAPIAPDLPGPRERSGFLDAPLTPTIALRAGLLEWDHRDPFDRLVAATAEAMDARLASRDPAFDGLTLRRAW